VSREHMQQIRIERKDGVGPSGEFLDPLALESVGIVGIVRGSVHWADFKVLPQVLSLPCIVALIGNDDRLAATFQPPQVSHLH